MAKFGRIVTDTFGRGPATHVANNHSNTIWAKVETERAYITNFQAGNVIGKLEWNKVHAGFTRIISGEFVRFDVGTFKNTVFLSVILEERNEMVLLCDNVEKSTDHSFIVTKDGQVVESEYGHIWKRRN